jgi:selenide,water dikinase
LPPEVAQKVIEGSRSICLEAGISLAGGHSIDSPEPIFGLAVNGIVSIENIKQNNTAQVGDVLFLTKKIGVGILTTAEKKGLLKDEHKELASLQMMQLNKIGEALGKLKFVHSITDVTGFGLLGHLTEMAEGSGVSAVINFSKVPLITPDLQFYINNKCIPGGTNRNWDSYGNKIEFGTGVNADNAKSILADPQTSGGLLIAVAPEATEEIKQLLTANNLYAEIIGSIVAEANEAVCVIG